MCSGRPSVPFLWTSRMSWRNFFNIGTNIHLDWGRNQLQFGGSKFKVQGHPELTKHIFWPLFNNFMIVLYSILLKWWSYLFLYPKGQRSTSIWRHNILQEKCSGHYLTAKLENSNLNGAKRHICNHTAADLVGQFKVVFLAMKKFLFWDLSSCAGGYKPRRCF